MIIAYLDEIFLSAILSITVFPMAMCFNKVGFLLPITILFDAETLLKLQDNTRIIAT